MWFQFRVYPGTCIYSRERKWKGNFKAASRQSAPRNRLYCPASTPLPSHPWPLPTGGPQEKTMDEVRSALASCAICLCVPTSHLHNSPKLRTHLPRCQLTTNLLRLQPFLKQLLTDEPLNLNTFRMPNYGNALWASKIMPYTVTLLTSRTSVWLIESL